MTFQPLAIRGLTGLGVAAVFGFVLLASPAAAATFTVTKTADTNDGTCAADCSLREAVVAANNAVGADEITLPAGTFTLTITGTGEGDAATGDLDIAEELTITGAGQDSTIIDGNGSVILEQVFSAGPSDFTVSDLTIQDGYVSINGQNGGGAIEFSGGGGELILTDVTLRDNVAGGVSAVGPDGGAIYVGSSGIVTLTRVLLENNQANTGGAIHSGADNSVVTIIDSTFSGNTAFREDANGNGGAISNGGTLDISGSTFTNNTAFSTGGAIYSICSNTTATIVNSTFVGNATLDSQSGAGGGAIASQCTFGTTNTDAIEISHSTIFDNTVAASSDGAGLLVNGGTTETATITIRNSIVAGNTDGTSEVNCTELDANATIVSADYNLESENDCGFAETNDQVSIPAVTILSIGGVADNGGETQTVQLANSSPAIDGGVCTDISAANVTTDQRGLARPENGSCDIGAVERDQTNPVLTLTGAATVAHECATTYTDAGGTATDNFHPDPIVNVDDSDVDENTPAAYTVDLTTSDYDGNADLDSRTVNVSDTTDPEVTLIGSATVEVKQYASYTDAGATADDSCDTSGFTFTAAAGFGATSVSTVTDLVDTSTVGTYTVTYYAEDASGNSTTAVRTVNVVSRGAVTNLEPMDNGKVRVTYADGSKQTFTIFPDATAAPKVKLSTNEQRIVGLNKKGTKVKVLDAFSGAILDTLQVRDNVQREAKLHLFDYYPALNDKDEIIITSKPKKSKLKTTVVSLTKNSNLINEDSETERFKKKDWRVKKKKTYLRLKRLGGDLIEEYKVTKNSNLRTPGDR